ncbi:J domain-containing protein [Nocardioides sp. T2.26MG-1]|uniref:J domain-containing protein n=1 Tax=Nocardioides sp. T2.26MG-1 TaxID=3041166 RepID=UPI0025418C48|nr:DnaJ domain-containing protein [Nocardioides sp. T2.26MG-1]
MSTPAPSWYDLLGVAPDAPAEEVRTAWRAQIADLDPTDRRFAVLNQAAEVLLDPRRRAAYDAELAAAAPEVEPAEPVEPVDPSAPVEPAAPAGSEAAAPAGRVAAVPGWLLAVAGALTLALVITVVVLWGREPSAGDVEGDARAARAAAERAVVPILSYDAAHLDESKAAAQQYLTGKLRTDYDRIFAGLIEKNAPSTQTVVTATLVRSSIVRADEGHAQVFLLVNQTRTNKKYTEPEVYKNWVTLTMDQVDGAWLVSDMAT